MKALVLREYNSFVYEDVATPSPNDLEVLIRVKACAVCGSDVHGMDGSTGRRQPPIIMGHEAAGVIEQCGTGVTKYRPGDRVTFDSTVYCNNCDQCRLGNINLCGERKVFGVSCADYRLDGAFAEYVAVPEHILYKLPDNVSFVDAAMVEPLAVSYHAATRAPLIENGAALIAGAGTIGILLLQVLKALGMQTVIVADIDNARLESAYKYGAAHCVNSGDKDALEGIIALTKSGQGVDIAFDAVGIEPTVQLCIKSAKLNGDIVLVGNIQQNIVFPLQWVVTRQQRLFGSCASAGEYGKCLQFISDGRVSVKGLVSKVVPLKDGNKWIKKVYNKEPGLYKIVLEP